MADGRVSIIKNSREDVLANGGNLTLTAHRPSPISTTRIVQDETASSSIGITLCDRWCHNSILKHKASLEIPAGGVRQQCRRQRRNPSSTAPHSLEFLMGGKDVDPASRIRRVVPTGHSSVLLSTVCLVCWRLHCSQSDQYIFCNRQCIKSE
jgi:hypothetical protein